MSSKLNPKLLEYIDQNAESFKSLLKEAVAIPSISALAAHRPDTVKMNLWMAKKLEAVGCKTELHDIGFQDIEGQHLPLPPVLVASLGNDPNKNTICIYGHLDVQPALKSDGWNTEPFELTEIDGKMFGRGSSDDKGPVLGWLNAIEAFQKTGEQLPVNLKFIFEGMEESGSEGLDDLVINKLKPAGFFDDVDFVCISDNYWLGTKKPCLTYGLRGLAYFFVEVKCADKDLHSGVYGGTVHEAMTDLIYLLDQLVDKDGKIKIKEVYDSVAPLNKTEDSLYDSIDFDTEDYRNTVGATRLAHNSDKKQVLMHRWRYPSLSLHGIEGAHAQPGAKTVIPGKVIGKFSIRLVPYQNPEEIKNIVTKYLNQKWTERDTPNILNIRCETGPWWTEDPKHPHYQAAANATKAIYGWSERGSPNTMRVYIHHGGPWWVKDPTHPHFEAAARATESVYGVYPDMSREGGSIPITITLQEASQRNVLLLPMGRGDDMAHSQNEKLDVSNYIQGTKLFAAYLHEVGLLKKPAPNQKQVEEAVPAVVGMQKRDACDCVHDD